MVQRKSEKQPMQQMNSNRLRLRDIALAAAGNKPFLDGVMAILKEAEKAVESHKPHCKTCGKCCNFSKTGHRLFVSTGELALVISASRTSQTKPLRCCYQKGASCTLRNHRPLGCRAYFCSNDTKSVFSDLYEAFHRKMKELHRQMNI